MEEKYAMEKEKMGLEKYIIIDRTDTGDLPGGVW